MSARAKPFAKAKRAVLRALRTRGIASVEIPYDGEGDSGQIGGVFAYDAGRQLVAINQPLTLSLHEDGKPTRYASLHGALDDFAWTVLGHYHSGFEDNEGGFGAIVIDVASGAVTLDHSDRFIEVHNSVTEV